LFNDTATGPTAVTLNTTVAPSGVTFNNSTLPYTLGGTGKITGPTGLSKAGASTLGITTTNDYTGVTTLEGGITSVATLTNGGVASPLGAATAAPEKLVFAGGTLNYTGGAVSIDRGLSLSAGNDAVMSELKIASDVTVSGQINSPLGKLTKSGPGTLILSGTTANGLGNGSAGDAVPQSLRLAEGALLFNGVGQTNTVTGRTAFGTTPSLTTTAEFANGASFTGTGRTFLAFADNTTSTLTVGDTSQLQLNDALIVTQGLNSVGNIVIEDAGKITKTGGYFSLGVGTGSTATLTIRNTGSFVGNGDFNVGDVNASTGNLNTQDDATVTWTGGVFIGKNNTIGTANLTGHTLFSSGDTNVGGNSGSNGALNIKGTSVYTSGGRLQVGPGGGSVGTVVIENSASMTVNSYVSVGFGGSGTLTIKNSGSFSNTDDLSVNENGDAAATVTLQDTATMSVARTIFVGRNATRVGTLNVTGASTLTQNDAAYSFIVGPAGTGTLNIQGTATVSVAGNSGVVVTNNATGTGTVNLDGGTLTTKKVSDAGGASSFFFNGGVLKAGTGADINFMGGLDTVKVAAGGAFIDSNGQTIAISQALGDLGGGLTKQGAGTLQLNGSNIYPGTTTVAAGTLGGTGSVAGRLVVPAGSTIAPGAAGVGTFTANDNLFIGSTIGGTYVCEISGATADKLVVGGDLDISAATLDFNVLSPPAAPVLIIASYDTLTGAAFATVNAQPPGYTLNYNYLGGNQIALVQTATPYSTWASSFGLDPFTDGAPGFDKDGDGQTNGVEFALGGSPISGSNNAKTFSLVADSDDGDADKELLLTIAVRSGTPIFMGSPSPTATQEGFTYTIEGSTSLSGFTTTATPVAPVAPPAPNDTAPAGYEYRTFSLDGSDGLTNKGFLRVKITN
jgi:autotransporter-associated beta strand protein/T5SS/PEP-CTERM-associated repeat protein